MVICANNHDNLGGLSHCRVCGLPLLNLQATFASLAESLNGRANMGRPAPKGLFVGLGTAGADLIDLCATTYPDNSSDYSYLEIDAGDGNRSEQSDAIPRLGLGARASRAGTFCGIGEEVARSDPLLVPFFRNAGLNRKDENQAIILAAGIGGGIGSAAAVLVEKSRQLNPGCHSVVLAIIPARDESFHNHLNAYYGLSHLLENPGSKAADLVIAVRYDRLKTIRGVSPCGEELTVNGVLAALSELLMKNLSSQYLAEVLRINQSLGVSLVVPCLAIGRSIEIFGSLANILESAIAYPVNRVTNQRIVVCHLLLRVPESQAAAFKEDTVNRQLWALVRRYFPGIMSVSSSITWTSERHDRIETCILLGGDSATSALFADDNSLMKFRGELINNVNWQNYGLSDERMKQANQAIAHYDEAMKQRGNRSETTMKC